MNQNQNFKIAIRVRKKQVTVVGCYEKRIHIQIPDKINSLPVTKICGHAFKSMKIKSVTFPKYLTVIESNAFSDNLLDTVILPPKIQSVRHDAFTNNPLRCIAIPDRIRKQNNNNNDNYYTKIDKKNKNYIKPCLLQILNETCTKYVSELIVDYLEPTYDIVVDIHRFYSKRKK
jgi:hypothetical protein